MVGPLSNLAPPSPFAGPGGGRSLIGVLHSLTSPLARSMGLGEGRADAWTQGARSHVAETVRGNGLQPSLPASAPVAPPAPPGLAQAAFARGQGLGNPAAGMPATAAGVSTTTTPAAAMPSMMATAGGAGPTTPLAAVVTAITTAAGAAAARPLADPSVSTALPRQATPGGVPPGAMAPTGAGPAMAGTAAGAPTGGQAAPAALQSAPGTPTATATANMLPRGAPVAAAVPATMTPTGPMAQPGTPAGSAFATNTANTSNASNASPTALAAQAQAAHLAGANPAHVAVRGEPALPGVLRADAALVAERAGAMPSSAMLAQAPGGTAAAAGATVALATAPPVPAMPTMPAVVPPSQSPADVRGNPLLAGAERGVTQPTGATVAHGHTVASSGDGRRDRRDRLGALLAAVGAGSEAARRELAEIQKAELAYQWLYWVLTIVAFSSFGILLVALLPWGEGIALVSRGVREPVSTGLLVALGLASAVGAWLVARMR